MSHPLVNYAFAATLWDKKKSLTEAVAPFVLKIFHDHGGEVTDQMVEKDLSKNFHLPIPGNMVQAIIKDLALQGLVDVKVTGKGLWRGHMSSRGKLRVRQCLESRLGVSRRQDQLIAAIGDWFLARKITKSTGQVQDMLLDYVRRYPAQLPVISPDQPMERTEPPTARGEEECCLIRFVLYVQGQNPSLYQSFNDLIKGGIICEQMVNSHTPAEQYRKEKIAVYQDADSVCRSRLACPLLKDTLPEGTAKKNTEDKEEHARGIQEEMEQLREEVKRLRREKNARNPERECNERPSPYSQVPHGEMKEERRHYIRDDKTQTEERGQRKYRIERERYIEMQIYMHFYPLRYMILIFIALAVLLIALTNAFHDVAQADIQWLNNLNILGPDFLKYIPAAIASSMVTVIKGRLLYDALRYHLCYRRLKDEYQERFGKEFDKKVKS